MSKVDSFLTSDDFKRNKMKHRALILAKQKAEKKEKIKMLIKASIFTLVIVFLPSVVEILL